jgi:hypothetical protein
MWQQVPKASSDKPPCVNGRLGWSLIWHYLTGLHNRPCSFPRIQERGAYFLCGFLRLSSTKRNGSNDMSSMMSSMTTGYVDVCWSMSRRHLVVYKYIQESAVLEQRGCRTALARHPRQPLIEILSYLSTAIMRT